ncbi:Uncharacterized conserved protein YgbK, DUF1537 family [Succinivibrio dextrinosolvens]|uniref:four-carbon acid sugar kinase family protein n=1 Tax=Succinivibrio dextrinosolvens TaxID=83771 RepID=UPI0008E3342B|nr:four-carbon acid sugar kinase family protein [Succinivibrio dextrinosolvens]SFS69278.1 Uncharacterized conserved protein YgbK, DUF1537 family [Succinivibrio dextrinosolvens]
MPLLPKIAIIADDLTGSADSAVQFASEEMATAVVMPGSDIPTDNNLDVIVIDSESRDVKEKDAYIEVTEACKKVLKLNMDILLYKKVDSTLRGNIGSELQAVSDTFKPQLIIFSPAFIPSERTTIDGVQYLKGVRLEETELARIPKSPVTTSDIKEIISKQSALKCSNLYIEDLNKSVEEIHQKIISSINDDVKILICDAAEASHQEKLVAACSGLNNIVYSGSAGLALALSRSLSASDKHKRDSKAISGVSKILVLAGSISKTTRTQTEELLKQFDCELIRTNPELTVSSPKESAKDCCNKIREALLKSDIVVVSAAFEASDVQRTAKEGERLGISFFEIGEIMASCMSDIMHECADLFDGYVLTGGDTAIHACKACNAGMLEIIEEVQSGIPLTKILTGNLKDRYLVTKAGAFGNDSAFTDAVKKLKHLEK